MIIFIDIGINSAAKPDGECRRLSSMPFDDEAAPDAAIDDSL